MAGGQGQQQWRRNRSPTTSGSGGPRRKRCRRPPTACSTLGKGGARRAAQLPDARRELSRQRADVAACEAQAARALRRLRGELVSKSGDNEDLDRLTQEASSDGRPRRSRIMSGGRRPPKRGTWTRTRPRRILKMMTTTTCCRRLRTTTRGRRASATTTAGAASGARLSLASSAPSARGTTSA